MVHTWRRIITDTRDPVNVMGLLDRNGVLRCLDHGDMISHSNGQVDHSVDDTLSVLDMRELHGLLLGRISSASVWRCGMNGTCGISTVFVIF